jgi:hypothetical protein
MDKGMKKKAMKMHQNKKEILNNDSMMNINPFVPSDIHSKISYDNIKSHSSMSRDGHEVVFTMKESLRDLDAFNLTPERSPPILMNQDSSNYYHNQHNNHQRYSRNFGEDRALFTS